MNEITLGVNALNCLLASLTEMIGRDAAAGPRALADYVVFRVMAFSMLLGR